MSSGTFVDRIDPFAKKSLKKKPKKSQGSSRYRTGGDVELTALPLLKGKSNTSHLKEVLVIEFSLPPNDKTVICCTNTIVKLCIQVR